MRFIHTADLHLAAPFGGLVDTPGNLQQSIQAATFNAFQQIVDLAIEKQVDLVIIAGDIFDDPHPSAQALGRFINQLQRLDDDGIPVIMCFGNHDHQIVSQLRLQLPKNVHLLRNQVETVTLTTKDSTTVSVTGFSYEQRWQQKSMIDQYPQHNQSDYQIGVLHGALGKAGDNYAPFNLEQLNSKNYDYWALGHIHQRQKLQSQPPVIYPGDPQGLSIKETGSKGCYLVENQGPQLMPKFIPLVGPIWQSQELTTVPGLTDVEQIECLIQQLRPKKDLATWQLVQLKVPLTDFSPSLLALFNGGQLLIDLQQALQNSNFWPINLVVSDELATTQLPKFDTSAWEYAAKQTFNDQTINFVAGTLLNDPAIRQSLINIKPEDWQQAALRYLQSTYQLEQKAGAQNAD